MKSLKVLLLGACVALCACSSPTSTVQTNDKGTQWQWENGTIVVETPQRPADRKSVIGLALPKMEVVRVGFVGLGMRGPGAVERFTISRYADRGALRLRNKDVPRHARNI